MVALGYAISSEELHPNEAIAAAQKAESLGFTFSLISDHYHPWVDAQGHSPFVWNVLGGIAATTKTLKIGTGVTCPTIRIHPAILAQAAATTGAMMEGRFFFGVGTGENLNEHILGDRWPSFDKRLEMLEEAIEVIRLLWQGGEQSHEGKYYTVENARIYTLPEQPVPIMIAASGEKTATLASEVADGLINTGPDAEIVKIFEKNGKSKNRPKYGQVGVCCHEDTATARKIAHEIWPIAGFKGQLNQELATPSQFEGAAKMVTEDDVAENIICGNDPDAHLEAIQKYVDAGYDHIYIHQIGHDQQPFFDFYEKTILPVFKKEFA